MQRSVRQHQWNGLAAGSFFPSTAATSWPPPPSARAVAEGAGRPRAARGAPRRARAADVAHGRQGREGGWTTLTSAPHRAVRQATAGQSRAFSISPAANPSDEVAELRGGAGGGRLGGTVRAREGALRWWSRKPAQSPPRPLRGVPARGGRAVAGAGGASSTRDGFETGWGVFVRAPRAVACRITRPRLVTTAPGEPGIRSSGARRSPASQTSRRGVDA